MIVFVKPFFNTFPVEGVVAFCAPRVLTGAKGFQTDRAVVESVRLFDDE